MAGELPRLGRIKQYRYGMPRQAFISSPTEIMLTSWMRLHGHQTVVDLRLQALMEIYECGMLSRLLFSPHFRSLKRIKVIYLLPGHRMERILPQRVICCQSGMPRQALSSSNS